MQKTTNAYNPYQKERVCWINVRFGLLDLEAAADSETDPSEVGSVSNVPQITNGIEVSRPYMVLNHNRSILNGTLYGLRRTDQIGWWSAQKSGEDGRFLNPPSLTFTFGSPHSSVGFSVLFGEGEEVCTDFRIDAWDAAGNLIGHKEITENRNTRAAVEMDIEHYSKVAITFIKTNRPLRYVRVIQVLFGIIQFQTEKNLANAKINWEMSRTGEALPADEYVMVIDNKDRRYNLINPHGIYKFREAGQVLEYSMGVGTVGEEKTETIPLGTSYFSDSKAGDGELTVEITSYNLFYFMDKTTYRRGKLGTTTLKDLATDIVRDAGYWDIPIVDRSDAGKRQVLSQVPAVSHREALRLAAQAAGTTIRTGRAGEIILEDLDADKEKEDVITLKEQYNVPEIEEGDRIGLVTVKTKDIAPEAGATTSTLYQGDAEINGTEEVWANYQGAAQNVSASVGGGTLTKAEYFLYAAKLTITATGKVTITITGTQLTETERPYTVKLPGAVSTDPELTIDNPLITKENAKNIAAWILKEKQSYQYTVTDRGNPAREVGDRVQIFDLFGVNKVAHATKIELDYDGTLNGTMEATGSR